MNMHEADFRDMCNCEPGIPDFSALVTNLQQQARDDLVAEFSQ